MRQSPPPPTAQSTSPRPKESSFLKSIGKELSSFGGFLGTPSKTSASKAPAPAKPPVPETRRSHRPAPKAPGGESKEPKEGSFPGVKLRSRETLLPPGQGQPSSSDLTEQDFDDLAGAVAVVVTLR